MKDGSEEAHVNWLADKEMLPAKLPSSRIMAFNYESKWLAEASKQRPFTCALHLLTALDNKRKEVTTFSNHIFTFMSLSNCRRRILHIDR